MILSCQGVSKAFGEKVILDDASFHIEEREKAALIGNNGAGKTTLLRILLGLEEADGGTVEGVPQRKSAVFQEDRLCGGLTAWTNIHLVCPEKDPAEIEKWLYYLGLGESMDQPVREYSGGMRQRVSVLRALWAEYDVLFLDEPLKGLDEEMRQKTAEFLCEHTRGKTVICVTHDQEDIGMLGAVQVIRLS